MKIYNIPASWKMYGIFQVRANSLEEAEELVLGEAGLPIGEYLDDSVELDIQSDNYPMDGEDEGDLDLENEL